MRAFLQLPVRDVLACLERLVDGPRPRAAMFLMLAALIVSWIVYVPIHELLHAGGCVLAGGSITRLEIDPLYGGTLLARVFPFVVSGSEYAGRLSGFDTNGSDFVYLVTDFAPFVLSVVLGVPLVRLCMRKRRPVLFGAACVLGLAPFYNVIGDYYEMGSIIVTHGLARASGQVIEHPTTDDSPPTPEASGAADSTAVTGNPRTNPGSGQAEKSPAEHEPAMNLPPSDSIAWSRLRGDDVFKRVGSVFTEPGHFGIRGPVQTLVALMVVLIAFALGIVLAFATYYLGHIVATVTVPVSPRD